MCRGSDGRQERRNSSTASTRRDSLLVEGSPSLVKIVETYFSTARSVITSASAMPWLELPVAISSSTSRSRGVSSASGSSLRRRESSVETIIGSSAEPPAATRRTAADELVDVGDAVLEQVAGARRRSPRAAVSASPSSTYCESTSTPTDGMALADLERRAQALVGVRRRQADVDDRDVRREAADLPQQLVGVVALGDHVEAGVAEQPRETLAQQDAVLGDRYAHGISARTRVPPPAGRPDAQPAAERLDAVGEAAQARAALGVGAADAVVGDLDDDLAVASRDVDRRRLAPARACRRWRGSRRRVVRRDLERLGQAVARARP